MRSAVLVASGIFLSRIAGFIRLRAFAHYFGVQSDAADAFNAAFRIPNFLQNLFGEGAKSEEGGTTGKPKYYSAAQVQTLETQIEELRTAARDAVRRGSTPSCRAERAPVRRRC